jgi:hypothetical protein
MLFLSEKIHVLFPIFFKKKVKKRFFMVSISKAFIKSELLKRKLITINGMPLLQGDFKDSQRKKSQFFFPFFPNLVASLEAPAPSHS